MADLELELADVRRYRADAAEETVTKIVKHYGIALQNPQSDSALLSASDPTEVERFRDKWAKGKLASALSDGDLDTQIGEVLAEMKGDNRKRRVTASYLLAEKLGALDSL
jgi:hypothetical protein